MDTMGLVEFMII